VASRIGIETEALELDSLQDAPPSDVYAVDEAHMFDFYDAEEIKLWLRRGKEVIIAGLNTDHAGHLMPTIAQILELSPETLINKQAVCEVCKGSATHTQVMNSDGTVIPKNMSAEVPDDGTYRYEARCRNCFVY
jgi:thymidine kinase